MPIETSCAARSTKLSGGDDLVFVRALADGSVLAVLADGSTGSRNGCAAAQTFVDQCFESLAVFPCEDDKLVMCFALADRRIRLGMAWGDTTGVAVVLEQSGEFVMAAVGDSECWLLDETLPARNLAAPAPRRPRLGQLAEHPLIVRGLLDTGYLVLMSDGVLRAIPLTDAVRLISGACDARIADRIADECLDRYPSGLPDDIAVAVLWSGRDPVHRHGAK